MGPLSRRIAFVLLLLVIAAPAGADPLAKLDPRARIALARIQAGTPVNTLQASQEAVDAAGDLDVFVRGSVSRAALEAAGARVRTALPGFYTASIPASAVSSVAALKGVRAISGATAVSPELDISVPATGAGVLRGAGPDFTGAAGAGVIIGDVDTGVDYNHGDFLDAGNQTRFLSIWDQNATGTPPAGFAYGAEYLPAALNAQTPPEVDTYGHGTHVMGIAGGDGSQTGGSTPAYTYVGMAPKADLIMVKTTFTTTAIVDGASYIFNKATSLGENAVVNLSLGSQYGPHDGTSDFESMLSGLTGPGRVIVKSAGNDRGAPIHVELFANTATTTTLSVTNSGGTTGCTFAVDGYYNATENLNVSVQTPLGITIGPITRGNINFAYPGGPTSNGTVYVENGAYTTSAGAYEVYVEVNTIAGQSMNGTWKITFSPVVIGAANGEVDLWRFYVAGSNGSSATTANFTSYVQSTEELISEPGNADSLVTVGAYVTRQDWTGCNGTLATYGDPPAGNLTTFSSPGPTRTGSQKPDITAPGAAIASTLTKDVTVSCPAFGTPTEFLGDGLNHRMWDGTSFAAPHVSGAVALLMERFGAISPSWVKQYLKEHANLSGVSAVWNKDWGWGKLYLPDIANPIATLLGPNGGESWNTGSTHSITWSASDIGGSGVSSVDLQISRTGAEGPFQNIATGIPNTGTHNWVVNGPGTANAYVKVTAHDGNGNSGADESNASFTIVDVAGVGDVGAVFALGRVSPNPSPGPTTVAYSLAREAHVKLSIVDVQGRQVAVLADGVLTAGQHTANWDGRIAGGRAPAGLYFARYQTPERTFVRRFALTR